jgi:ferredoxin
MPDDAPMDRRRFFRRGLSELIRPIASAIGPLERVAQKIGELERVTPHSPPLPPGQAASSQATPARTAISELSLRPPGALAEVKFLQTCSRSGECVKVCPAQCIKIDSTGVKGNGAPRIDIDSAACVVCDGLYCMHVCPSGALALGETAITVKDGEIAVKPLGCIGCGICQQYCPTSPKSIIVIPKAAKEQF